MQDVKPKRWVVIFDTHVPNHSKPAMWCALEAVKIIKPYGFLHGGDFAEMVTASHWNWKKKKRPPLDYQLTEIDRELIEANGVLDTIDRICKEAGVQKKVFLQGNHDEWLDRLVEENPHLAKTKHPTGDGYLFKDAFRLKQRGYKFYPLGELCRLGKLYLYHGHHHGGINHTRNHLIKMGVNVLYGHWHDVAQSSLTHVDGAKSAWSLGCLKSFEHEHGNEWLGRRQTNWGHAFAVVDVWGKGQFTVNVVRIIDGRCSLEGRMLDGNAQKSTSH